MVKLEMLGEGYPEFETDHDPVDLAAIARAAGLFGRRVEKPDEVADGIREVLAPPARRCSTWSPNPLSIPPTITADQVRGFALGRRGSRCPAAAGGVHRVVAGA